MVGQGMGAEPEAVPVVGQGAGAEPEAVASPGATWRTSSAATPAGGVRVGFVAPEAAGEVAELVAAGAGSLWVGGHVASVNPSPEPLVWLARLIEQTAGVAVGTATLALPLYPPGLLAKQLADLDRASGGRITVGVGVGGEYPADFAACEVPLAERGARADEMIPLLRRFWTAAPVTHDGPHHRFRDVRIHPAPARTGGPPLVVTGRRAPAIRRAARLGDGWMPYLYSPERYARAARDIHDEARKVGRDLAGFGWYAYVFTSVADTTGEARKHMLDFLGGTFRQDAEAILDRVAAAGTPDEVAARLRAFAAAGAEHLILCPCGPDPHATALRLLEDVVPAV
ncbi:LLM class flavin-dependent oxidoreductase [Yinghuangia sp. YIM S09857]|uniref:LLM class flavin-dependent oxidoreductase n=1 Tax=Yinghuangia sp. YIM S09857 TaxID=3436929 RepID=UPI003F5355A4